MASVGRKEGFGSAMVIATSSAAQADGPAEALPVVVVGLGEIGREVARAVLDSPSLRLFAALEIDPRLQGQPLSALLGRPAGDLRVQEESPKLLRLASGGVLLQTTGSHLAAVFGQLERALQAGLHAISSCEELSFPWLRHPELAEKLDRAARKASRSVLGTGINPGFVLDRLACTLGAAAGKIVRVHGERVVDAGTRREQLQRKVGCGLTVEQFEKGVAAGKIGHVGLVESAALISSGLALDCDEFEESVEPILATRAFAGPVPVRVGHVAGIHQTARGFDSGRETVTLDLTIALGAQDPHDEIRIEGDPPLLLRAPGGLAGDRSTAWNMVNAITAVVASSEPGLMTVLDLPAGR
jgi:2,4-diaminopentanoate dehydrogenase